MLNEDKRILLITDATGQYIPQVFMKMIEDNEPQKKWRGIEPDDQKILLEGPDHEYYWDTWEMVLQNAFCVINGQYWYINQDGDLWAVRHDYEWDEE